MNDIHALGGLASSRMLRELTEQVSQGPSDSGGTAVADRVEISELAALLSRLSELPEERARKVVSIRNSIQNGTYETDDKLDVAADRLLIDLAKS